MTKEELMQMAQGAGFDDYELERMLSIFANAILERAAREPGNVQLSLGTSEALDDAANRIRALKINTGD